MSKHCRTSPRRRSSLVLEELESRNAPGSLLSLAGVTAIGATGYSVVEHSSGAGGGGIQLASV